MADGLKQFKVLVLSSLNEHRIFIGFMLLYSVMPLFVGILFDVTLLLMPLYMSAFVLFKKSASTILLYQIENIKSEGEPGLHFLMYRK